LQYVLKKRLKFGHFDVRENATGALTISGTQTSHIKLKSLVTHFRARRKIVRRVRVCSVRGGHFYCNAKENHSYSYRNPQHFDHINEGN
jgi:hypothetical protein